MSMTLLWLSGSGNGANECSKVYVMVQLGGGHGSQVEAARVAAAVVWHQELGGGLHQVGSVVSHPRRPLPRGTDPLTLFSSEAISVDTRHVVIHLLVLFLVLTRLCSQGICNGGICSMLCRIYAVRSL